MNTCVAAAVEQSFSPAQLAEVNRALQAIAYDDPGPDWIVGMVNREAQHVRRLGGHATTQGVLIEWGSISKTVTAMLLASAALRGLLDVDEPLARVLDEARHMPEWLTLDRLASHTVCLPANPPGMLRAWWHDRRNPWAALTTETLLDGLRTTKPPRERPAAAAWRYSNFGYALLGAALERRTGLRYEALVDAWLAQPFGLASLGVGAKAHGILWPLEAGGGRATVPWDFSGAAAAAGALRSTVEDLLRWGMLVAAPPEPLRAVIELVRARRVDLVKPMRNMVSFCLGWGVCRPPDLSCEMWMHDGATYGSLSTLALCAGERPCVVALARNRGLSLRSLLDRRTRAVEPTLISLVRAMSAA